MKTTENLQAAFTREAQDYMKYLAFAKQAEEDGHPQVAKLFRVTAEAEKIHAQYHFVALQQVQSTADNVTMAIENETDEFSNLYPRFILEAKGEGNASAAIRSFTIANATEKIHVKLYRKALESLEKEETFPYYLCKLCGHIQEGSLPICCPICGAREELYEQFD